MTHYIQGYPATKDTVLRLILTAHVPNMFLPDSLNSTNPIGDSRRHACASLSVCAGLHTNRVWEP